MSDWREALPEELRAEPMFKDIQDVPTLAKVARDLKQYQGRSIQLPAEGADEAVRKEFFDKLSDKVPELAKPEKAEDYSLEGLELGEVQLDAKKVRELAKGMGLTQGQFREMAKLEVAGLTAASEASKAAHKELRALWGNDYADKVEEAATTAEALGFPGDAEELRQGRMSAVRARAWAYTAAKVRGGTNEVGGQGNGAAGQSSATAMLEYLTLVQDPDYFDPNKNPARHKQLAVKSLELWKAAHPS